MDLERTHWGMGMRAWNADVGEHEACAESGDADQLSVLATE